MSALFNQFIIETRELLEQAANGLLTLEKKPGDDAALNQVFRAFHSMKGAAALFDFDAMTHLMHAGEDLLGAAREAELQLGTEQVDLLLAALDQVERWVDSGERQNTLPSGDQATELVAQLRAVLRPQQDEAGDQETGRSAGMSLDWLDRLPAEAVATARRQAGRLLAVRYLPDEGSFYSGDDPFNLVRQIPQRYGMLVEPTAPWPELDALDPYRCVLQIYILTGASPEEVGQLFHSLGDEVTLCEVPVAALPGHDSHGHGAAPGDEPIAVQQFRRLLSLQRQLLEMPVADEERAGRLRAAVAVLCNGLHAIGQDQDIAPLELALGRAERMKDPQPVLRCLDIMLADSPMEAEVATPASTVQADRSLSDARHAISSLRVSAGKIDRLIELTGELIVARNGLPSLARRAEQVYGQPALAREILAHAQSIDRALREMQHSVMAIRMLPVTHLFTPLPRQVRDLARVLSKDVRLETRGEDTEADKQIIEVMAEPLLHLIRNSIDHGIEPSSERLAAGKPATGVVRVSAHQESDRVVVEVTDDGRGLDPAAIRRRALKRGMMDAAELAGMDDEQVLQLIFMPGFSTAASISEISGRGVGMDVVRSRVERAGGRVELQSTIGAGTQVRLLLPLQMALSRVLVVAAGGQSLGVPLALVRETVRLPAGMVQTIKRHQAFTLRDEVLPLVSLRRMLEMPEPEPAVNLAVMVVNGQQGNVGVIVDDFQGEQEVLQKPVQDLLGDVPGYSGSAVLADGSILLILDVQELL